MCHSQRHLAFVVAVLTCGSIDAASPATDEGTEDLLTTWRCTVQDIDCFKAKVTRWDYEHQKQTVYLSVGELYIEKGDKGSYHVGAAPKSRHVEVPIRGEIYSRRSAGSTFIVWTGERTLCIDEDEKRYHSAPTEMFQALNPSTARADSAALPSKPSFFVSFQSFVSGIGALATPRQTLPFLALDTYSDSDPRFNVVVCSPDERSLTATPKLAIDKLRYNEITVLLDRTSGLPIATRCVGPFGEYETVHVLHDIEIDPPEELRRAVLSPALHGYVGTIH